MSFIGKAPPQKNCEYFSKLRVGEAFPMNDIDFLSLRVIFHQKKWDLIGHPVKNEMGFDGVPVLRILGGGEARKSETPY